MKTVPEKPYNFELMGIKLNKKEIKEMADLNNKNLGKDITELAKVWNNLSDDMQKLLAKAITGEEYASSLCAMTSSIGKYYNEKNTVENIADFTKYIIKEINTIKELDNTLVNLKTNTDK